eukprot:TRINITY_DN290_c0_g1_i4.p2 TRINITY_DN290_c0_g1~~TRINITY_DN290_c0_g1_i4.p2  ORF type:complete len:107 (+),score=24.49 TRINITY_DN290_c0_g1_i4:19-339(+)
MSRPARVLGRPDSEDEDTRGMSAQQIYDMRQQKLDEQDNDLDQILASVRRQKEVGIAIGAETDDQLKLLGRLDGSVEREEHSKLHSSVHNLLHDPHSRRPPLAMPE